MQKMSFWVKLYPRTHKLRNDDFVKLKQQNKSAFHQTWNGLDFLRTLDINRTLLAEFTDLFNSFISYPDPSAIFGCTVRRNNRNVELWKRKLFLVRTGEKLIISLQRDCFDTDFYYLYYFGIHLEKY